MKKYRIKLTPHSKDSHGHIFRRRTIVLEVEAESLEFALSDLNELRKWIQEFEFDLDDIKIIEKKSQTR